MRYAAIVTAFALALYAASANAPETRAGVAELVARTIATVFGRHQ